MSQNDDFLRRFAVEIATALREREQGTEAGARQPPQARNQCELRTEDSVDDLYGALVFDEPLVDHVAPNLTVAASALSRQLSDSGSSYALSNRLVNGVIYLCNRRATPPKPTPPKPTPGNDGNDNGNDNGGPNNPNNPNHSTMQIAMAKLAFCILIDIPLECCRNNLPSEGAWKNIRSFLGSYKGAAISNANAAAAAAANSNPDSIAAGDASAHLDSKGTPATTTATTTTAMDLSEEKIDPDATNNKIGDSSSKEEDNDGVPQDKQYDQEVWAAESDPSDYDYGEGDADVDADADAVLGVDNWQQQQLQQQQQQQQRDGDWLDPMVLSKPDPNLTLQQTRDAIGSLLQLANYTLLQPIFCLPQKHTSRYVSQLKQLILVLLQPRKQESALPSSPSPSPSPSSIPPSSETNNSLLLDSSMDHAILYPLWILRDAATYHTTRTRTRTRTRTTTTTSSSSSMKNSTASHYEELYLEVLQTLVGMDQAYLQDMGAAALPGTNKQRQQQQQIDLCVSSIVGLSSLSSWCLARQQRPTRATIDAVVDSMNDLEHVVQRGREKNYKHNLPNTLIPIMEMLSGIGYDRVNSNGNNNNNNNYNNSSTAAYYKGSVIPQTLLNSGFLRQILALVVDDVDVDVDDHDHDHDKDVSTTGDGLLGFHHALWGLCSAYPNIVGKYVFRYPGSSRIVRSYATVARRLETEIDIDTERAAPQNCVQSVLWNLYGWHHCQETSGGALHRLRTPGSSSSSFSKAPVPNLTRDECGEVCRKAWARLCRLVVDALEGSGDETGAERVIREWGRLLVLVKIPFLATHFKSLVDSSLLTDISAALSIASSNNNSNSDNDNDNDSEHNRLELASNEDSKKEDEKDKDDKPSRKQKIVSQAHKLWKEYKLFFQGTVVGSSKTD